MERNYAAADAVQSTLSGTALNCLRKRIFDHVVMTSIACLRGDSDCQVFGVQVDARLPLEAQERLKQRMARMFAVRDVDSSAASAALKAAYHDVTCKHILCQQ